MHRLIELQEHIKSRSAVVGVVGLGSAGVTIAASFAKAGFRVRGVDLSGARIAALEDGKLPLVGNEPGLPELLTSVTGSKQLTLSTDHATLAEADVLLVAVETSVGEDNRPSYDVLRAAATTIGKVMKRGALVVVESTVSPGTTEKVVRPALEEASGTKEGDGFFVGHCPVRVAPGKLLANLRTLPRVCGAIATETARVMATFYRSVVEADVEETDCVTAEIVNTAENAYRDVRIAFANELAIVCEHAGVDFRRVQRLVDTAAPPAGMPTAGAGVGGPTLPAAPWMMIDGVADDLKGFEPRIVPAARAVNDEMPLHVARLVEEALIEADQSLAGSRIAVLGYGYREGTSDTRHAPSAILVTHLRERGADVVVHDPYVSSHTGDVYARTRGAHAAILMVAHDEYRTLDLKQLRQSLIAPILVDARHIVETPAAIEAGFTKFRAVGRGKVSPPST